MPQKQFKVFFIDDDQATIIMVKEHFAVHFPEISLVIFDSAEKAIAMIQETPDLIILDHLLNSVDEKAMDGLTALSKIRKVNNSIPLVVLSAQGDPDVSARFMKAGAYDYIVKNNEAFPRLDLIITHFNKHMLLDHTVISKKLYGVLLIVAVLIIVLFLLFNMGS